MQQEPFIINEDADCRTYKKVKLGVCQIYCKSERDRGRERNTKRDRFYRFIVGNYSLNVNKRTKYFRLQRITISMDLGSNPIYCSLRIKVVATDVEFN